MKLNPVAETGGSRKGTLYATYQEIVENVFAPNATDLDDSDKVKASWGIQDGIGRKCFIWCFKVDSVKKCNRWSVDGSKELLIDIFGDKIEMFE